MSNAQTKAAAKLTFTKMESISGIPGDNGCQVMYQGDDRETHVGEIVRHMDEVGLGLTQEYRVGAYEVDFIMKDFLTPVVLRDFPFPNNDAATRAAHECLFVASDYGSARKAHTAAKNWARAALKANPSWGVEGIKAFRASKAAS